MRSDENSISWVRPYYPAFDGLRGVAVLLVLVRHFASSLWPSRLVFGAWVGVDLFFVLSGFLITGILFDGLERPRYFRNFYVRRALRIFPLFYGFFLVLLLLQSVLTVRYSGYLWSYALYLGNLVHSTVDLRLHNPSMFFIGHHGAWHAISVGHLWSLCVEEQFYLAWPVLVYFVRCRRRLMQVCGVGAVLVLALRVALYLWAGPRFLGNGGIYFSTFTRVDTLLVGSWMALWLRGVTLRRSEVRRISGWLIGSSLLALLAGALLTVERWPSAASNPFLSTVGYTLIALLMAGVLLRSLDDQGWLYRAMQWKRLQMVGLTSYGVYFLHNFLVCPVQEITARWLVPRHLGWAGPVSGIVVSVLLARLSFFWVEMPFLRLKPLLAPSEPATAQRMPMRVKLAFGVSATLIAGALLVALARHARGATTNEMATLVAGGSRLSQGDWGNLTNGGRGSGASAGREGQRGRLLWSSPSQRSEQVR